MFPETFTDYVIISYIMQYSFLAIIIAHIIRQDIQPKALILRKQNETYYKIATVNLKRKWDVFFHDEKAYAIQWDKVAYHIQSYWHHVPRYLYLENVPTPLTIGSSIELKDLGEIMKKTKRVVKDHIVKDLINASKSGFGGFGITLMFILLAVGVGIGIGWITHSVLYPPVNATQLGG